MNPRLLLRLMRLARRPPGPRQIRVMLVVIALVAVIAGYELFFGWPDWATVNQSIRVPR